MLLRRYHNVTVEHNSVPVELESVQEKRKDEPETAQAEEKASGNRRRSRNKSS